MKITTTHKIIATLLLPILVFAGGIALRSQIFWEELHGREESRVEKAYLTIENAMSVAINDLTFIRQNPSLLIYAKTGEEVRRKEFEQFLVGLSNAKKSYQQLRYIDQNGVEQVRVDNSGHAEAISKPQLQDKSNRYYFIDATKLDDGEVFISKLDLNMERGQIETPYKPMIRFVAPVFVRGERHGVIVLNYLADDFLSEMRQILSDNIQGYVLNSEGYWLVAPKAQLEWGFMFAREDRFQKKLENEWALLNEGERDFTTRNGVFHVEYYYPDFLQLHATSNSFQGVYIVSHAKTGAWAGFELREHALEFVAFALVLIAIGFTSRKVISHQNSETEKENIIREKLQNALMASEVKNTAIVEIAHEGILTCAIDGTILDSNPTAQRLFKYNDKRMLGLNLYDFIQEMDEEAIDTFELSIRKREKFPLKVTMKSSDNSIYPAELTITEAQGEKVDGYFIAFIRDITRQKKYEEGLRKLAHYDFLTGLPNRYSLHDFLEGIGKEKTNTMCTYAVILLGLDEFHVVNDTLGHHIGDEVLKSVAKQLHKLFPEACKITRLAGDEFVVVIDVGGDKESANKACESIIEDFNHSLTVNEHEIHISMSIGLAFEPKDGVHASDILQHADSAMHIAKGRTKNSYAVYTQEMSADNERRHLLQNKIPYALSNEELEVYFQPLIDAQTQEIKGAEALLRWHNDELGFVSPVEFIPIAEKSGQIVPIGEWVLKQACDFVKELRVSRPDFFVAINVSPIQFMACDMSQVLSKIIDEFQLHASALEIELTEGVLVQDPEGAERTLNDLIALGVSVSIDDFGTGYSSLSYLSRYPFQTLKIDRAFIMGLPDDNSSKGLSAAILSMAEQLGLKVIAEGTETLEQVNWLANEGAHILQGYYFDKPLPRNEFIQKYSLVKDN